MQARVLESRNVNAGDNTYATKRGPSVLLLQHTPEADGPERNLAISAADAGWDESREMSKRRV